MAGRLRALPDSPRRSPKSAARRGPTTRNGRLTERGHRPPARRKPAASRGSASPSTSCSTSPLVRARQTADVVASTFDPRPPIVAIESLAPGGTYQAVLADLEKQARRSRIALVGHEPGIGELAARTDRLASSVRVQEGRGLPHRRRNAAARRPRRAALVRDAEDSPDAAEIDRSSSPAESPEHRAPITLSDSPPATRGPAP